MHVSMQKRFCGVLLLALLSVLLFLLAGGCATNSSTNTSVSNTVKILQDPLSNPEPATQQSDAENNKKSESGDRLFVRQKSGTEFVAVTANPHASEAAYNILELGGSAIDAAIAAQMVLGLVEPQSSGIGGGGFLLYWDNKTRQLYTYDGRETAPAAASEKLFLDRDGKPLKFGEAMIGGRSVGVPGLLRMLERAHKDHGNIEWKGLFSEAIDLAENGFAVSPRLHSLIQQVPWLDKRPDLAGYLFEDGMPLPVGHELHNPNYADSLRKIAQRGVSTFYAGALAQSIVAKVNEDVNAGHLSLADMKGYQAVLRKPVCKAVFNYRICGMGPPSSGATAVLSVLAQLEVLLENGELEKGDTISEDADTAHAFIEVSRLAFADRNTYLADPDFVDAIPDVIDDLLDDAYINQRAMLVDMDMRMDAVSAGDPKNRKGVSFVTAEGFDIPSTTHLSIVDAGGNIVSMTSSVESAFGSRLMVSGFILNNQLTDFSFVPSKPDGGKIANRVEGGKRPLSSMSPMIIFNQSNDPVMVVGSPGGRSIITYVARVIYDHIVGGLNLTDAIDGKHVVGTGRLRLEVGISDSLVAGLREKGHQPALRGQSSGIHALHRIPGGWQGVADPRREGTVAAK